MPRRKVEKHSLKGTMPSLEEFLRIAAAAVGGSTEKPSESDIVDYLTWLACARPRSFLSLLGSLLKIEIDEEKRALRAGPACYAKWKSDE
jgi:hypothetical protein